MNDIKAIMVAAVLAAGIGATGHWAVTAHGAAVAEAQRQAREAKLAAEAAAREAAEAKAEAERRQRAVELAQAGAGAVTGGTYNPMARPANPMLSNPMMPGAPAGGGAAPGVDLNPEFGNLPDAEGMEETFYLCSSCHSVAIIKQQRISDARWDYLWTWMIEQQGMPEQSPESKETILSYLKQHFSSER